MGDDGKMYLPKELLESFKEKIIPSATIITPNQFEAELITGTKIECEQDALHVCERLHQMGPVTVIITSLEQSVCPQDMLTIIASTKVKQKQGKPQQVKIMTKRVNGIFTGTGDLFCALILGWLHQYPDDMQLALQKVVNTVSQIVDKTVNFSGKEVFEQYNKTVSVCRARELQLVSSRDIILNPGDKYIAQEISLLN